MEQRTPTVRVEIERMPRYLIIDTGSTVSISQPCMSERDVSVTITRPYWATGEVLDINGLESVTFTLNGREFTQAYQVCAFPADAAGLLGNEFFDFECTKMSLTGIGNVPRVLRVPYAGHAALTIFTESKAGRSSQLSQKEARKHQSKTQPAHTLRLHGNKKIRRLLKLGRTLLYHYFANRLSLES